jgi:Uma2 family endonuclease
MHDPSTGRREVVLEPARTVSPDEYLAFERAAETKHEYLDGRVFAMAAASLRHNRLVTNLIVGLHTAARGTKCEVLPSNMRLHVVASGLYAYPDVTLVCGEPELEDAHLDTLLNPTVLIEVLSPSTVRYDRGREAEHYRTIESLREYLLVSQDRVHIEQYRRTGLRQWTLTEAVGREDGITIDAIGSTLRLAEVYDGMEFD